jgi:uncharacterized protein (TIGR03435 family)
MAHLFTRFLDNIPIAGVTMPGSRLSTRIAHIASGRATQRISRPRTMFLIAMCVLISSAFAAGTLARAREKDEAQSTPLGQRPKFEVASVKPCAPGDPGADLKDGNFGVQWSPGRLTVMCQPLKLLIAGAYVAYADGDQPLATAPLIAYISSLNVPFEGLPSWADSERFTIRAETPAGVTKEMLMGPMMQSLLEDRFHSKIHVETRQVAAFDLVVTKAGAKLPQTGTQICRFLDPNHPGQRVGPANLPRCTRQMNNVTMADFAAVLRDPPSVNGPVFDKTGLKGTFDIHMFFATDHDASPNANSADDSFGAPTFLQALKEQLGLELVSTRGPDKILVIDHIEEPSPN